MGLGIFATLIQNLNNMGFYGFVLPWLLVFAIVYAILQKTKVFGDQAKNINGLIALIFAFFVTGYAGDAVGNFFINIFGGSSIIFGGILVFLLFGGMLGFKIDEDTNKNVIGLVAVIIAILLFLAVGGPSVAGIRLTDEMMGAIFMVLVVAFAVMFITGGEKPGKT
ncbi:MAG: hypothetical protein B6U68_03775 [Candidatus Aenigmarchaeota archaeon ex4484_14]|nr:MAG: hypothetical protein B6U68_03775 [Candidatus Aenigmarchaeota archaeon ex4484_14]